MDDVAEVSFDYDNDTGVWIATSDDIIGLVLEDDSPEKLMSRVLDAIPELIELNRLPRYKTINFSVTSCERASIA